MSPDHLLPLLQLTLVSSVAILVVGTLRKPLRLVAGAQAAYWLWLLVPLDALALLLPAPSEKLRAIAHAALPVDVNISAALAGGPASQGPADWAAIAGWIWLLGALLFAGWLILRQRAFVRSLGPLTQDSAGVLRSARIVAPLLVGAWRPRLIVPADFEKRYPAADRQLMLAHERAHQERGDTLVNALATIWSCVFWFNPLVHWATARLRLDQELACDALVMSRFDSARRRYADALLKAQLVSEADWPVPVGCHWQSTHPLKERIIMLGIPSPTRARRLAGVAFTLALAVCGMSVVSASAAQTPAKFSVDAENLETRKVIEIIAQKGAQNILVSDQVSGKITVHLKDVTWREALDIVAQSGGLTTRQSGNLVLVDVAR